MAVKKDAKKTKTPAKTVKKAVKEAPKKAAKAVKKTGDAAQVAVNLENKQQIIEQFAQKQGDTGSPEVQVALLSFKITRLTSHLDINKKDNHSRRGLLKVIAKRRRILNYLQKLDEARYKELLKKVQLKK